MAFIPEVFRYGSMGGSGVQFSTGFAPISVAAADMLYWYECVQTKGWIVDSYVLPTLSPGVDPATSRHNEERVVALYNADHRLLAFYWIAGRDAYKNEGKSV